MATRIGRHAERLAAVRALRTVKGRREQRRFAFEGVTLLAEAVSAKVPIQELYVTERAYESTPVLAEVERNGTAAYIVPEAAAAAISDVATPSGIVAVSPVLLRPLGELFGAAGLVVVLADLNDPANAGTLLRSADAFGAAAVIFGRTGVDPHHPKVIRGSMGACFRVPVGVGGPREVAEAAHQAGVPIVGLAAGGRPIEEERWGSRQALVIGNERHGLADWGGICERVLAIAMRGSAESLSAGVAGSIALYQATRA